MFMEIVFNFSNIRYGIDSPNHCVNVANAFERVVEASVGKFNEYFLNRALMILWIYKFGASENLG